MTLVQAMCALLVVAAILIGGIAVALLAGQAERSGLDLLIAGRIFGL